MQKKKQMFWQGIGEYLLERAWVVGIGLVIGVGIASWNSRETSLVGVKTVREAIVKAAGAGDYGAARGLYEQCQASLCHGGAEQVLGAETELEELVYPERRTGREIAKYERLNQEYPGHRDILLHLAGLYGESGNLGMESKYWEEARRLDPNNPIFLP